MLSKHVVMPDHFQLRVDFDASGYPMDQQRKVGFQICMDGVDLVYPHHDLYTEDNKGAIGAPVSSPGILHRYVLSMAAKQSVPMIADYIGALLDVVDEIYGDEDMKVGDYMNYDTAAKEWTQRAYAWLK